MAITQARMLALIEAGEAFAHRFQRIAQELSEATVQNLSARDVSEALALTGVLHPPLQAFLAIQLERNHYNKTVTINAGQKFRAETKRRAEGRGINNTGEMPLPRREHLRADNFASHSAPAGGRDVVDSFYADLAKQIDADDKPGDLARRLAKVPDSKPKPEPEVLSLPEPAPLPEPALAFDPPPGFAADSAADDLGLPLDTPKGIAEAKPAWESKKNSRG